MVRKALKWMFCLWLLAGILPLAGTWTASVVSSWIASRPTAAEARISELAKELDTGELTADDLEAALLEIAELRESEEAEPAARTPPSPSPPRPTPAKGGQFLEAVSQATRAAIATESDPTTSADVAAAEARAETAILELDVLYRRWIAALEAVQEAHTDVCERRWAGDRVTNATGARRHELRDIRLDMTQTLTTSSGTLYSEWRKYDAAARRAIRRQEKVRAELAVAQLTLAVMQATGPEARDQGPTDQPADAGR